MTAKNQPPEYLKDFLNASFKKENPAQKKAIKRFFHSLWESGALFISEVDDMETLCITLPEEEETLPANFPPPVQHKDLSTPNLKNSFLKIGVAMPVSCHGCNTLLEQHAAWDQEANKLFCDSCLKKAMGAAAKSA